MNYSDPVWLDTMRRAGMVARYHAHRMSRTQSVGAHVYGVLVCLMAAGEAGDATLLQAALLHDAPEVKTGDVPAPAKRNDALRHALFDLEAEFLHEHGLSPLYDGLTDRQKLLVQWADIYELCQFSLEDLQMGNSFAMTCLRNGVRVLMQDKFHQISPTIDRMNTRMAKEAAAYGI